MTRRDWLVLGVLSALYVAGIPVLMLCLARQWPEEFLPPASGFATWFGSFCSALGLFYAGWAVVTMHRYGHGGPAVIGSLHLNTPTRRLVTQGPYAVCRNPLHTGMILYSLGAWISINNLAALLVPLGVVIFAVAVVLLSDEPRLKREFGAEYEAWAAVVPRFFPRMTRPR